jgi:dipeptidyl aminopeptidase/acylaminoacyl peptidase
MTRGTLMLLVATAIAVLLAGCGSSKKEDQGSSQQTSEPATNETSVGRCADSGSTVGQQEEARRGEVSNGKIAFQRRAPSGAGDIYVMDADDTNETRLTANPAADWDAVWSPDGEKIAFRGLDSGPFGNESDLYVTDEDGTNEEHLTSSMMDERIVHGHPTWSPDGTKIAFISERLGRSRIDLYVINADGTDRTRLAIDVGEFVSWGSG